MALAKPVLPLCKIFGSIVLPDENHIDTVPHPGLGNSTFTLFAFNHTELNQYVQL